MSQIFRNNCYSLLELNDDIVHRFLEAVDEINYLHFPPWQFYHRPVTEVFSGIIISLIITFGWCYIEINKGSVFTSQCSYNLSVAWLSWILKAIWTAVINRIQTLLTGVKCHSVGFWRTILLINFAEVNTFHFPVFSRSGCLLLQSYRSRLSQTDRESADAVNVRGKFLSTVNNNPRWILYQNSDCMIEKQQ